MNAASDGEGGTAARTYFGLIVMLVSLPLFFMAICTALLGEVNHFLSFAIPGIISLLVGSALYFTNREDSLPPLTLRAAMATVVGGWVFAFFISALPFSLGGILTYRLGLFEAVSGWTTTGLSVVTEEAIPQVFLLWRSLMQYLGGAGFAIAMLSAIIGPVGAGLSRAEGRQEIMPMIKQSATTIGLIYVSYGVIVTVGFRIFGMSWFDALNHSMTTLSTGGFSTRGASIGAWQSSRLELFTMAAMLVGNLNFMTHHNLIHGRWRRAADNPDLKVLLSTLGAAALAVWAAPAISAAGQQLDYAFQMISALSTTGFGTVDYGAQWTDAALMLVIVLMCIGGGVNSTAGGLKQRRVYLLYKSIAWQVREHLLPSQAVVSHSISDHGRVIDIPDSEIRQVGSFVFLFLATLAAATLGIAAYGYSLTDSLFEAASALGTVGLSVGVTAPDAPAGVLWIQKLCMFAGRLEFFAIIVAVRRWLEIMSR